MSNHLDSVPEWLDAVFMQTKLRTALRKPNFTVKEIKVTPGSNIGDNYVGQIFRIQIFYEEDGAKTMSVIGKYQPPTKIAGAISDNHDVFATEAIFFSDILPRLKELCSFENDFAPKVHFIEMEKKLVIMEDLKELGFYMQQRNRFLNKEQARLTIEALAKLHGSSYYLLQKNPDMKKYKGILWCEDKSPIIYKVANNALISIEKIADTFGFSEEWTKKLKELKVRLLSNGWFKVCELQEDGLNFILHGDCWKNNMMYHDTNGKTDDVKLYDYQVFYYGSFANDLQYFLFTSVSSDVILADLDYLLLCYHNKLKETAPDIPNQTLDRVKLEFSERYLFGFYLSVLFRPFTVCEVPTDAEKILDGGFEDAGLKSEIFISDLRKFLPYFEELGVF